MNAAASIALNRFGLGARPDEAAPTDPKGWLLAQFDRYEPRPAAWQALPGTTALVQDFLLKQRNIQKISTEADKQAARQALQREAREQYLASVGARADTALHTASPFIERLVHFWAKHFAVSVDKGPQVLATAGALEADAIRPHVLGRFEDMLVAVERHPAMLLFLDQAQSIGPDSVAGMRAAQAAQNRRGLNENLAREIMELHTLGVRSGYTQADVTEFARALTGFTLASLPPAGDSIGTSPFMFRPALHQPGARTLMGRSYEAPGEQQALAMLHDLATAPATAQHLATKLARHFVADNPPPALVDRLADAYLRSRGELPAVYRELVAAPEAWQQPLAKFKTPWEWSISGLRALGRRDAPPMQVANLMNQLGQPVWRPGSPAGWDDIAASWAAPDALVRRVEVAQRVAAQAGDAVDARALAPRVLPGVLTEATQTAIARSESSASGLALLLVSPEFLRR